MKRTSKWSDLLMVLGLGMASSSQGGTIAQETHYKGPAGQVYEVLKRTSASKLELCLLLDASESMDNDVQALRSEYEALAKDLRAKYPDGIRTRVVRYGLEAGVNSDILESDDSQNLGIRGLNNFRVGHGSYEFEVESSEDKCLPFFSDSTKDSASAPIDRQIIAITDEPAATDSKQEWERLLPKLAANGINYTAVDPETGRTHGPLLVYDSKNGVRVESNPDQCESVVRGSDLFKELESFAGQVTAPVSKWLLTHPEGAKVVKLISPTRETSIQLPFLAGKIDQTSSVLAVSPDQNNYLIKTDQQLLLIRIQASGEAKLSRLRLEDTVRAPSDGSEAGKLQGVDKAWWGPNGRAFVTQQTVVRTTGRAVLPDTKILGPYGSLVGMEFKSSVGHQSLALWVLKDGRYQPSEVLLQGQGIDEVQFSKDGSAVFVRTSDKKARGIKLKERENP